MAAGHRVVCGNGTSGSPGRISAGVSLTGRARQPPGRERDRHVRHRTRSRSLDTGWRAGQHPPHPWTCHRGGYGPPPDTGTRGAPDARRRARPVRRAGPGETGRGEIRENRAPGPTPYIIGPAQLPRSAPWWSAPTRFTMLLHLPPMARPRRRAPRGEQRPRAWPGPRRRGPSGTRIAAAIPPPCPPSCAGRSPGTQGAEMAGPPRSCASIPGLAIYFLRPRAVPWQARQQRETLTGCWRQYFPKGTDLSRHSAGDLAASRRWHSNGRPPQDTGLEDPRQKRWADLLGDTPRPEQRRAGRRRLPPAAHHPKGGRAAYRAAPLRPQGC